LITATPTKTPTSTSTTTPTNTPTISYTPTNTVTNTLTNGSTIATVTPLTTLTPIPVSTITPTPTLTVTVGQLSTPTPTETPTTTTLATNGLFKWYVVHKETGLTYTFKNTSSFEFIPPQEGIYYIEVSVYNIDGKYIRICGASSPNRALATENTVIPDLTAISAFQTEKLHVDVTSPNSGFVLEHKLNGWSYTYNSPRTSYNDLNIGAKPFWAKIFTDKDSSTNYKSVFSTGYYNDYIDDYIPHHIPVLSPLALEYDKVVEYERNGPSFWWNQPITFKQFTNKTLWSQLQFNTTIPVLSSIFKLKSSIKSLHSL